MTIVADCTLALGEESGAVAEHVAADVISSLVKRCATFYIGTLSRLALLFEILYLQN
jgi:hypothetical protein